MACKMKGQSLVMSLLNAIGDPVQKERLSELIVNFEEYAQEFQLNLGGISFENRSILEKEYPELFFEKAFA